MTATADTTRPTYWSRIDLIRDMQMSPWAEVGDPLAEAVVATMRDRRLPMKDPIPEIRRLAADGDQPCRDFLDDIETPPAWADFDRMRPGGAMAARHFLQYSVALGHGALMTTFCNAEAAYILARTGRFERDVPRRLAESGALFFGVLDTDGLRPGGPAWAVCVRVRLMHTMIRLQLLRTDAWPMFGIPISALQTAAGPLYFGDMTLDRLRALGAQITPAEAEGLKLTWRYVTRLLGVPPELVGETADEQAALNERISPFYFRPDDTSRYLAQVLISGFAGVRGAGLAPRQVHEALVRHLLGDEPADAMGIARRPLGRVVLRAISLLLKPYGWVQRLPGVAGRLELFGRRWLDATMSAGLAGKPADLQPLDH